uniref:Uncharacterized protein B17C10.200 n=1 Tax=Neurospora crassa TaxID=5141 RepID=Q9P6C9_NEUCS|nr:hypothetical protein [Neurospora crassa]
MEAGMRPMLASVSVELAGALSRVMTAGVPVGGQPALSSLSGARLVSPGPSLGCSREAPHGNGPFPAHHVNNAVKHLRFWSHLVRAGPIRDPAVMFHPHTF